MCLSKFCIYMPIHLIFFALAVLHSSSAQRPQSAHVFHLTTQTENDKVEYSGQHPFLLSVIHRAACKHAHAALNRVLKPACSLPWPSISAVLAYSSAFEPQLCHQAAVQLVLRPSFHLPFCTLVKPFLKHIRSHLAVVRRALAYACRPPANKQ